MREILFRGKRKDNGKWVEGFYQPYKNKEGCFIGEHETNFTLIPKLHAVYFETVGQFTGLTDRNGVRIFEGDILKSCAHQGTRIYTVDWCSDCAMFVLPCITNEKWETDFANCSGEDFEIIGNVHDNPELLKGIKGAPPERPDWKETMLKKMD